jgi:hypothetical protein
MSTEELLLEHLQGMQDTLETCSAVKGEGFADTVKLMVTLSIGMGHAASHRIEDCAYMMQQAALMFMEKAGVNRDEYGELARMANALGNQLEATVRCCHGD